MCNHIFQSFGTQAELDEHHLEEHQSALYALYSFVGRWGWVQGVQARLVFLQIVLIQLCLGAKNADVAKMYQTQHALRHVTLIQPLQGEAAGLACQLYQKAGGCQPVSAMHYSKSLGFRMHMDAATCEQQHDCGKAVQELHVA